MFIYNFNFNNKNFKKIFIGIIITLAIILIIISVLQLINSLKNTSKISNTNDLIKVTSENYTNFLKDCHENIDNYIDSKVTITGYIYKMPDFTDNQFVIARTMLLDTDSASVKNCLANDETITANGVVVGILCINNNSENNDNLNSVNNKEISNFNFFNNDNSNSFNNSNNFNDYKAGDWISVEGIMSKTNYHGTELPAISITSIKKADAPAQEYVFEPQD